MQTGVLPGLVEGTPSRPPGEVMPFAGATIPTGWLLCDGSSYDRSKYPALFAAIGTAYGSASGATFNVPNLIGRIIVMQDAGQTEFVALGTSGGSKSSTASHTHTLNNHSHSGVSGGEASHNHGNTGTESVFHQHGNGVGTNTTAHGHVSTGDNQYSGAPSTGGFFLSQNVGNQSALHVHGTGAGTNHTHSVAGDSSNTSDSSVTAASGNLQPYLTMNYLIKW